MTTRCRIEGLEPRVLLAVPVLAAGVQMQAGGSALHVSWDAAPEVADWNGDGTQDLLVGQYTDGNIWYFANNGTVTSPQLATGTQVWANGGPITTTYG